MENAKKVFSKQLLIGVGGIVTLILIFVVGMWANDPNKGQPTSLELQKEKAAEVTKNFTKSSSVVNSEEAWISKSEQRLLDMELQIKLLRDENERLRNQGSNKNDNGVGTHVDLTDPAQAPLPPINYGLEATSSNTNDPLVTLLSEKVVNDFSTGGARQLPPTPQYKSTGSPTALNPSINANGQLAAQPSGQPNSPMIQMIDLSDEKSSADNKATKNVAHYLPAGSFATAVLLSGMDAPTGGQAKTNPVPVLLRIKDAGQLPNYFNSDVDNCHVTGAGYGDISSERANVRLELLTCVLVNGDIIEEKIAGYVTGEDGKAGLRGRLVSKQGSLIAKSLLAGIASGMGNSISQQYQQVSTSALGNVTSFDPNRVVENGLATGTSNALEKIADFYIARATETYPIIEVDANRIGEIILTGGTELGKNLIDNTREKPL